MMVAGQSRRGKRRGIDIGSGKSFMTKEMKGPRHGSKSRLTKPLGHLVQLLSTVRCMAKEVPDSVLGGR